MDEMASFDLLRKRLVLAPDFAKSDSSPLLAKSLGIKWIIANKVQGIIKFM